MKMKCCFVLFLCFVLNCCQGVYGASEYNVKRGMHPFMAFIYYSDPSILDISKQRFIRSAVLIRADWLVTTAIGPSLLNPATGFPKKTLLARAGAISIDPNFTLNEDEDEQEREIVQIVRPYNHSATQWWTTDISLMKTLLPFNMTSAVDSQSLTFKKPDSSYLTCSILVFAKTYGNVTEDKNLIALFVDLLPPSISNCGSHFSADTMACAVDNDDNKHAEYDPHFCQGNSGGPLLCNNDVIGLQTYIGNDCKQPHLYQILYPWDNFITCATEDKCQKEQCKDTCDVIYKDPSRVEEKHTRPVTQDLARDSTGAPLAPVVIVSAPTQTTTIDKPTPTITTVTTTLASKTSELLTADTVTVDLKEVTTTKETKATTPDTTTTKATVTESTEKITEVDETSNGLETKHTSTSLRIQNTELDTDDTTESIMKITEKKTWPKEKMNSNKNNVEEVERKAEVEAQLAPSQKTRRVDSVDNAANRNLNLLQIMLFGFIVCFIVDL